MNPRTSLAIAACKLSRHIIHLLGRGGTNLPGKLALYLCPDLLNRLSKNVTTILVTGTNGKTTTSRMIAQAMTDAGMDFFENKTGANLLAGVVAEYAVHSDTLRGKCRYQYALIETDEAAFVAISAAVKAEVIVVNNLFRDQLDRFGEVTNTLEKLRAGIQNSPDAVLCINADDSLCATLGENTAQQVLYFGVDTPIYQHRAAEVSDAPYCIHCKHPYSYDYITYGHLGGYRCPHCGYHRPRPQITVSKIRVCDQDHSEVEFLLSGSVDSPVRLDAAINVPGGYNIYNAAACMATGQALGLEPVLVANSLSHFQCGFGRMEKFDIGETALRMILIKNPAGCNQVLNFLGNTTGKLVFVACLNDHEADGTDVSWIWDVDMEQLQLLGDRLVRIYVSGTRAEDMALRFKYAGIPTEKIILEKDYDLLLEALTTQPDPVYIMPTYTAMLDLRARISRNYGFQNYWET